MPMAPVEPHAQHSCTWQHRARARACLKPMQTKDSTEQHTGVEQGVSSKMGGWSEEKRCFPTELRPCLLPTKLPPCLLPIISFMPAGTDGHTSVTGVSWDCKWCCEKVWREEYLVNLSILQPVSSALLGPAITIPLLLEISLSLRQRLLESPALTPVFSGLVHLVQTSPPQVPGPSDSVEVPARSHFH